MVDVEWMQPLSTFRHTYYYLALIIVKLHEIFKVDSGENCQNCYHQMSLSYSWNAPNSTSAGALPQTPLGDLTALLQRSPRPLAIFKGPSSKEREV